MTDRKRVVITMEKGPGSRYQDIFVEDVMRELEMLADVVHNDLGRAYTTDELATVARDADAIITSWGAPVIDISVVQSAPRLRIIAHAAGSVKNLIRPEVWDAGIVVTNAAAVMAPYVGEHALCLALAMLRMLPAHIAEDDGKGSALSASARDKTETLFGKTVGIIGLSHTGKAFLRLLRPFGCRVLAYDPYCNQEKAQELDVALVSLEELLSSSKVISLHAPVTPETEGMLDAKRLRLIQDGAIFINTARGALVDHDALTSELMTGRFSAALDVTRPEPLPLDHPLRRLPNVLLTPHIAGPTVDGRRDMFRCVVEDLKLFWSGQRPKNEVTKDMLATMA